MRTVLLLLAFATAAWAQPAELAPFQLDGASGQPVGVTAGHAVSVGDGFAIVVGTGSNPQGVVWLGPNGGRDEVQVVEGFGWLDKATLHAEADGALLLASLTRDGESLRVQRLRIGVEPQDVAEFRLDEIGSAGRYNLSDLQARALPGGSTLVAGTLRIGGENPDPFAVAVSPSGEVRLLVAPTPDQQDGLFAVAVAPDGRVALGCWIHKIPYYYNPYSLGLFSSGNDERDLLFYFLDADLDPVLVGGTPDVVAETAGRSWILDAAASADGWVFTGAATFAFDPAAPAQSRAFRLTMNARGEVQGLDEFGTPLPEDEWAEPMAAGDAAVVFQRRAFGKTRGVWAARPDGTMAEIVPDHARARAVSADGRAVLVTRYDTYLEYDRYAILPLD